MGKDKVLVGDILDCIKRIEGYVAGLDANAFFESLLIQDAVVRNIEIIGEASKRISQEFKQKHAEIPWKDITGMRDNLIHDYINVDCDEVWKTVTQDIPDLKKKLS